MIETQKLICLKYGSRFSLPSHILNVGLALKSLSHSPIHGVREPESEGSSGWYIWAGDYSEDPSFFSPVHLVHLYDLVPAVIPYLGLEAGFKFVIDGMGYEDVWKDEN